MNCPICRTGMVVVEYNEVELDHCMECGGVWFDRDELSHLLSGVNLRVEDLHMKAAPRAELAARNERPRRCPLCRRKMKKLAVGESDAVVVDRCDRHGGYWFDGGELPSVVRKSFPNGEWKNVVDFISTLFPGGGKHKEENQ
ncbi:MAG: zf-TFIIB domain-containing protein [bacterium]